MKAPRRILAAVIATLALCPWSAPVAASGEIGPFYGAQVLCNPYENVISINPRAGANPAWDSQWIYADMWLYQDGRLRTDITPPMTSMFRHDRRFATQEFDFMGPRYDITTDRLGPGWDARPGEGRYQIYTRYWFWDGAAWSGPYGAWTNGMDYTYSLGAHSASVCDLTLV